MKYLQPYRLLATCLFLFLILAQTGCAWYQRYPMSKSRLPKIDANNLTFYLIDPSRPLSGVWYVGSYNFGEKSMQAYLSRLSEREALDVTAVRNNRDARNSRNEVLIYVKPQVARGFADTLTTRLDYDQLERVEVYEVNYGKTLAFNFLGYAAIGLLLALLALAAKGSCPFVYALNPDGTPLQGELYSGSTYPQLERHDWLPLPALRPNDGAYQVRIANKVKEIQHTNLLELVAVDHPVGTEVLFDKKGQLHTLNRSQSPVQAVDFEGQDVKKFIEKTDTLTWYGNPANPRPRAEDGLVLTFEKPAGANQAKLMINAKNTFWMDYMYGLFLDEFGEYAGYVRKQYLEKSEADIRRWMDEQNIPLSVSVETAPGEWTKADYFHVAGPMALKKDVMLLDLSQVSGNQVKIKLESGFQFWEIDYAALDFSADIPVAIQTMKPISAVTQTGDDMAAALATDDALYYTQPNIGDEAIVRYAIPPQAQGTARSLLLHAKGHYEILRAPTEGKPNLLYLREFQKPDALPKYSRHRWEELMRPELLEKEES